MPFTVTSADVAVVFLDLQTEIVKNARTIAGDRVIARAAILARLAALHELPTFASSVPPGGAYAREILAPWNGVARPRTSTSAFDDATLATDLAASGRRVLVLAGVASEIVVQRTALDALDAGYRVQVAIDACGGASERSEFAAWQRIGAAGGVLTSVTTLCAEVAGDFSTKRGGATLGLMYETLGA